MTQAPPRPPNGATAAQTSNKWKMRMNNNGLPVCRDLFDLYTAMVLSLSERWTDSVSYTHLTLPTNREV